MENLKVIIVENNLVFREDFKSILEKEFSANVIGVFDDDKNLLTFQEVAFADIVFVNLLIARKTSFQMIKDFLWKNPDAKVIGLNSFLSEQIYLLQLIEIGFRGCIDSNNIYNELREAVNRVRSGSIYFSSTISNLLNSQNNNLFK